MGLAAALLLWALPTSHPLPWDRALSTLGLAPAALVHGPGHAWVSRPQSPPLGTLSWHPALSGDAPSLAGLPSAHLVMQRFKQSFAIILLCKPD